MKFDQRTTIKAVAVSSLLVTGSVLAGTTGSEFQALKSTFEGWVTGYAGQAVAIGAIGMGALTSLAKQTPYPILGGIGVAILEQYTPAVVTSIMTLTV